MSKQYCVRIENTKGSRTKYEFDKEHNDLVLDRIIHSSSAYMFDYGYIEGTMGGDGDPIDAIVLCSEGLIPNCLVWCRAIGMLDTEDEKGRDEKIIMVPITKVDPEYSDVVSIDDNIINKKKEFIKHFFERYKENEPGKECCVKEFYGPEKAVEVIEEGIVAYEKLALIHTEKLKTQLHNDKKSIILELITGDKEIIDALKKIITN